MSTIQLVYNRFLEIQVQFSFCCHQTLLCYILVCYFENPLFKIQHIAVVQIHSHFSEDTDLVQAFCFQPPNKFLILPVYILLFFPEVHICFRNMYFLITQNLHYICFLLLNLQYMSICLCLSEHAKKKIFFKQDFKNLLENVFVCNICIQQRIFVLVTGRVFRNAVKRRPGSEFMCCLECQQF